MSKRIFLSLALAGGLALAPAATAGIYTDQLGTCLTTKASDGDKTLLMKWMFSAMALHPAIQSMGTVTISPEQRAETDKQMGELFIRLLTADCRAESVAAIKNEGAPAIAAAFQTLGEIAGGGLMTAPEVAAGMSGVEAHIDTAKLAELAQEAAQ